MRNVDDFGEDTTSPVALSLELAWGLIANAYGGDWKSAPDDWRKAAERWRDEQYHPSLDDGPMRSLDEGIE